MSSTLHGVPWSGPAFLDSFTILMQFFPPHFEQTEHYAFQFPHFLPDSRSRVNEGLYTQCCVLASGP